MEDYVGNIPAESANEIDLEYERLMVIHLIKEVAALSVKVGIPYKHIVKMFMSQYVYMMSADGRKSDEIANDLNVSRNTYFSIKRGILEDVGLVLNTDLNNVNLTSLLKYIFRFLTNGLTIDKLNTIISSQISNLEFSKDDIQSALYELVENGVLKKEGNYYIPLGDQNFEDLCNETSSIQTEVSGTGGIGIELKINLPKWICLLLNK